MILAISPPPFARPLDAARHLFAFLLMLFALALFSSFSASSRADTDFNGDNLPDLLWQNQNTGDVSHWLMNGASRTSAGYIAYGVDTNWKIVGTPDLNGDGKPDLLWQNRVTGDISYWLMDGLTKVSDGFIVHGASTQDKIIATPDLDGDGKPDLLWYNPTNGNLSYWLLNGTQVKSTAYLAQGISTDWQLVAAVDLNGDGSADFLWQNQSNGDVSYWIMNGLQKVSDGYILHGAPTNYKIVGVTDINGDGSADLLWRDMNTGQMSYWLMSGTQKIGDGFLNGYSNVPLDWSLVGMRGNSLNYSLLNITNVATGDTLTGNVTIHVSLPNQNYQYGDVTLSLDGQQIAYGGDSSKQLDGSRAVDLALQTDAYSNGSHFLAVQDTYGNIVTRTVTFNNSIGNMTTSPIFDVTPGVTDVPAVCHITASLPTAQAWTITIQTTEDTPTTVQTFSGNSANIDVTWNGIDTTGAEADDGVYTVLFIIPGKPNPPGRRIINKNRIGDCFLLLVNDGNVFRQDDNGASLRSYKNFILRLVKPQVGNDFTKINVIVTSGSDLGGPLSSSVVDRINNQLAVKLNLFYVDAHGGNLPRPFFGIGPFTWYSYLTNSDYQNNTMTNDRRDPRHIRGTSVNLGNLVAPIGYGDRVDPPGMVWIDSCESAGGNLDGTPGFGVDGSFGDTFHAGSFGYGVFLGWSGECGAYGYQPPPSDCWDFWRRQYWTEIFVPRNFGTALTNADNKTMGYGFGSVSYSQRPNDRRRMSGSEQSSF